ncbi:conserved hypothetical protein, partial [Burkholderia cenocepacia PC184]
MVDRPTLDAYDAHAAQYAQDWLDQAAPDDMYALLEQHFSPGLTADVGCGAGRDTAWLASRGFDVRGYDASAALLDEARRRHRDLTFELAALPALAGVPSGAFRQRAVRNGRHASRTGGCSGGCRAAGRSADAGRHVVPELAGGRKRHVARRARPPLYAARFGADACGAGHGRARDRRTRGRQRVVRQARAPADRAQGGRRRV